MAIVGGLDIHRKQLTFDYLDTGTGQVTRGQVSPADREHLRGWLARFADRKNTKRAALSEARKIVRQACHILAELDDDALTAA